MKTHSSRRPSGFTLVELLVVIAIIVVLAAAGFGAAMTAMKKAKAVKTKTVATSIEQAINQFYNEYNKLPDPSGTLSADSDPPLDTSTGEGVKLLTILLGKETGTGADVQNTKRMVFLNVPEGKGNKDGLIYEGDEIKGLYDPFGSGYQVVLDGDYNEEIKPPENTSASGSTSASNVLRGRHCIVYSLGSDKKGKAEAIKTF
ncbi:type II secretion system protein [Luteolibacter ambystomatis]|uniref:Type II secretion system protein n=1 Tax=Luteolibacter ambystomatis TaxID=2824561 RepID=A0A975G6Q1_9BACT|nr:type II secretion system protein [Luteolibacter ambystomatis]QUE49968.1 type II secretion system protein [Luteolibacter ambystomatis]